MTEYFEEAPQSPASMGDQSTEKSIKSCYAVVYELENRKWVVSGEGGWSEVHLCEDALDNSHRILAWTVKSQQVLMNCNVTSDCTYKEKSKNFHSFSDENSNRYGLGFHKSESGLKQATHFLKSVVSVIQECKNEEIGYNEQPPFVNTEQSSVVVPDEYNNNHNNNNNNEQPGSASGDLSGGGGGYNRGGGGSGGGGMPPPNPYQYSSSQTNESHQIQQELQQINKNNDNNYNNNKNNNNHNNNKNKNHAPPQMMSQSNGVEQKEEALQKPKAKPSAQSFQPTYHLKKEQHKSLPAAPIGPLGHLKILPPKQQKHFGGDAKIKNPTTVEHKMRVTHDKETGLYSGLPAEWMEHLNKQFGVNPKLLNGVKYELYKSKIPKVLIKLRKQLEVLNAYQQVGIFRLAPNASDNKTIKDKINKGQLADNEQVDINIYANLLKVWFRDLPDPLLNCVNPDQIEHVTSQQDALNVVKTMKEPNKSIFLWLCDMCVDIAKSKDVNKMGPQNMAIVVGPNLFNTDQFENPMKAMTYSGKVVEFFKNAILWRQSLSNF